MKLTIELENESDLEASGRSMMDLATKCLRAIPGRPTVVIVVPAKAHGLEKGPKGKTFPVDMRFEVTPR